MIIFNLLLTTYTWRYIMDYSLSIYDDNFPFDLDEVMTMMHDAAKEGDLEVISNFVEKQADVNTQCQAKNNSTVLMCAAFHGRVEVVKYLLNVCQADPNIVNNYGESALSNAVKMGNYVTVDLLIKAGANTSIVLPSGETLLQSAINDGYKYTAFRLLCEMPLQQVIALEQNPAYAPTIAKFKNKILNKQHEMLNLLGCNLQDNPYVAAAAPSKSILNCPSEIISEILLQCILNKVHYPSWYDHRKGYDAALAQNKVREIRFSRLPKTVSISSAYQPDNMEINVEEKVTPKKKDRSVLL